MHVLYAPLRHVYSNNSKSKNPKSASSYPVEVTTKLIFSFYFLQLSMIIQYSVPCRTYGMSDLWYLLVEFRTYDTFLKMSGLWDIELVGIRKFDYLKFNFSFVGLMGRRTCEMSDLWDVGLMGDTCTTAPSDY